jgi:hypothetical protein
MNKSKYTPGPWTLEKQRDDAEYTAIGEPIAIIGGEDCCEVIKFIVGRCCDYGPHGDEQTTANAQLIAAAPDLLAACKALQAEAAARGCGLRIADEAIAKAEGKP